jgi:class 3 adenylate cyclase
MFQEVARAGAPRATPEVERFVHAHPEADLIDLVRSGAVAGLQVPAPPPGDPPIHLAQLFPAVVAAVAADPTAASADLARRAVETCQEPQVASDSFGTSYVPRVVEFFRGNRERLDRLDEQIAFARAHRMQESARTVLRARPSLTEEELEAATAARLALTSGLRRADLARAVPEVVSMERVWRRDVRRLRGLDVGRLPVQGRVQPPIPALAGAFSGLGSSTVRRDADGVIRRQPLLFRIPADADDPLTTAGRSAAEGLAAAGRGEPVVLQANLPALGHLADLDLDSIDLTAGELTVARRGGRAPLVLPVDPSGRLLIDFRGRWGEDGFERVNAARLLDLVDIQVRRDRYLRSHAKYLQEIVVADVLGRLGQRVSGSTIPVPTGAAHAIATAARGALDGCVKLQAGRAAAVADLVMEKLSMDERSLLSALDAARKTPGSPDEEAIRKELARTDDVYRPFLIDLPLLKDSLRRQVQGRFCLVGVTATSTTDISAIPLQERCINLGIHATVLNQALHGSRLRRSGWASVDLPVLLINLLLVPLIVARLSIRAGALAITGLLGFHVVLSALLLIYAGLWIDMTTPVLAAGSAYVLISLRRHAREIRQKQKIRAMFETYLDPRIVEQMVTDERCWTELGGTARTITAFFSDIEGFTSISEMLDPEELSQMLVGYLTPMTQVILLHDGIRDKYIGDAIVAFFGAPVPYADHARKACLASITQMERIASLRQQWLTDGAAWYRKIRDRGLDLRFRIGVNTGVAKVGNFGAAAAKNYTMIGDNVNLASRLEGANKEYRSRVMISESTYQAARQDVEVRELDSLRVVGRLQPVRVFELLGRNGQVDPALIAMSRRFTEALELYRARRFGEAGRLFGEIHREFPDDGPTGTYVARLADARFIESLPEDWDGTYVSRQK